MGSVGIETKPTSTMTIAMTIAKTGRSMKNFAIESYFDGWGGGASFGFTMAPGRTF